MIHIPAHFYNLKVGMPEYIVSGCHLASYAGGMESIKTIEKFANVLWTQKQNMIPVIAQA
jgi:hypothetical protein